MKVKESGVASSNLVIMLHGTSSGIDSVLFRTIYDKLKNNKSNKVVAMEFSFIGDKTAPDPDQIIESDESAAYLKTQNYTKLAIIGHSSGGFVGLVASTRGIRINHLILLGLSNVTKDGTKQAIANIIQEITSQKNKVTIIQPESDPYSKPVEVAAFIKEFKLKTEVIIIPGNHYFAGHEAELSKALEELI